MSRKRDEIITLKLGKMSLQTQVGTYTIPLLLDLSCNNGSRMKKLFITMLSLMEKSIE